MADDSVVYDHEERTVQRQNERITAEFLALLWRERNLRAAEVATQARAAKEKAA